METIHLVRSKKDTKRYDAIFSDGMSRNKRVSFGQAGGSTFIDHRDAHKKENYLKRHKVNESWDNPYTPGALSRWLLWNKPTLEASLQDYGIRFHIKPV